MKVEQHIIDLLHEVTSLQQQIQESFDPESISYRIKAILHKVEASKCEFKSEDVKSFLMKSLQFDENMIIAGEFDDINAAKDEIDSSISLLITGICGISVSRLHKVLEAKDPRFLGRMGQTLEESSEDM